MNLGKAIRLKRLIEPQYGSCIICALDHGMTSPNFLDGLYDTRKRTQEAIAGGGNVGDNRTEAVYERGRGLVQVLEHQRLLRQPNALLVPLVRKLLP